MSTDRRHCTARLTVRRVCRWPIGHVESFIPLSTRADNEGFVDATRHEPPRDWSHPLFAQGDLPVVGVSWIDAVAYCAWRSGQDGRPVRLPTEAEWEFAARGRHEALFPWGDVMPDWIPNGGRGPLQAPWPVTLGEPTDFGLLGIATNVHEWCANWHDKG